MVSLLFSFRGRINRKQYWIGTTLVGFISCLVNVMTTAMQLGSLNGKEPVANALAALSSSAMGLPLYGLVLWCSLAIQFKRFHDRGRTGWISMAPIAVTVMLVVTLISDAFANVPLAQLFSDLTPWFVILMLISLGFLIDLGCLGSVEGANKYGPPPGTPPASLDPSRPSGAVDAASSLFGAQSAMDRAIAEKSAPAAAQPAQRPTPALRPAFASAGVRAPAQPAPAGFGRRVAR